LAILTPNCITLCNPSVSYLLESSKTHKWERGKIKWERGKIFWGSGFVRTIRGSGIYLMPLVTGTRTPMSSRSA
jgi:hypothetical protein